jgi:ABC-type multidrug transport system permease subunit
VRIINHIKYTILNSIKEKSGVISMVVFPIIFMLILGSALANTFDNNVDLDSLNIVYVDNGSKNTKDIFDQFKSEQKDGKVTFKKADSIDEGKGIVRKDSDNILVELQSDNIQVYKNEKDNISVNIVMGGLQGIAERYGVYGAIVKFAPNAIKNVDNDFSKSYTKISKVEIGRQTTSFDYYGIVEITMMTLYGSMFGFFMVVMGRDMKIEGRTIVSGMSRVEYVFTKIIATFIITFVTLIPAFLFATFVLKVYWGDHLMSIIAIMLALDLFASSLGVCLGFMFKEEKTGQMILNVVLIPAMTFLGGGYMYIGEHVNAALDLATKISPVRWVNRTIINIAFNNDFSKFNTTLIICLSLSIILMIVPFVIRREEA